MKYTAKQVPLKAKTKNKKPYRSRRTTAKIIWVQNHHPLVVPKWCREKKCGGRRPASLSEALSSPVTTGGSAGEGSQLFPGHTDAPRYRHKETGTRQQTFKHESHLPGLLLLGEEEEEAGPPPRATAGCRRAQRRISSMVRGLAGAGAPQGGEGAGAGSRPGTPVQGCGWRGGGGERGASPTEQG